MQKDQKFEQSLKQINDERIEKLFLECLDMVKKEAEKQGATMSYNQIRVYRKFFTHGAWAMYNFIEADYKHNMKQMVKLK